MNKNCSNCANAGRPAYDYPCNVCATGYNGDWTMWEKKEELVSNADRIRTMSDKELAHELALIAGWDREQYKKADRVGIEKFMLNWLRSAAEGK